MDHSNKRKYPRIPAQQSLHIENMEGDILCAGCTLNVSEGGVCILCDTEFQEGETYKLVFNFTSDHSSTLISALSVVIYQHPDSGIYRTGFKFDDHHYYQQIKDWVKHCSSKHDSK